MLDQTRLFANKRDVPYQSLIKGFLQKWIDAEFLQSWVNYEYSKHNPHGTQADSPR